MRKVLLAFGLIAFLGAGVSAQEAKTDAAATVQNANAPVMTFESEVVDYGTIEQGSPY